MKCLLCGIAVAAALAVASDSLAVDLFTENFEVNPTAAWTVNNNNLGTNAADFFFDYNSVGIPSAPHSGGTTRGLKIGANLNSATAPVVNQLPGISVSPTGKSFTGNYTLEFDWWHNYIGPLNTTTQAGSTMLSIFGILTSGSVANFAGVADGVWFGATGDGGSAIDYRIASSETPVGYATPDPLGHAVYAAGSRNSSAALYTGLFTSASAPASQASGFASQSGATTAGAAGFRWNDVKIIKTGTLISWKINDTLLGTVDTANFSVATAGTNILFGDSDINNTTSSDLAYPQLAFTLIDNIVLSSSPANNPDFNGNGIVDAADYPIWRRYLGLIGTGTQLTGDANGDGNVNPADYDLWRAAFGTTPGSGALGNSTVPEPPTFSLIVAAVAALANRRRR